MAKPEVLALLQSELLAGAESRKCYRSTNTVKSYMSAIMAAMSWAYKMGWVREPVRFDKQSPETMDVMKGRPLTDEEFKRLLNACKSACGDAAKSWRFLLRGLWESGLRLAEAMNLSWDVAGTIQPVRSATGQVFLRIPGHRQKNRKSQEVPTTPMFKQLLESVKPDKRTGWVFNPEKQRKRYGARYSAEFVGRVITSIGEKAGITVND